MKFKKGVSLLLVGVIVSSLMVGCNKKEEDTTDKEIVREIVIKEKQVGKNKGKQESKNKITKNKEEIKKSEIQNNNKEENEEEEELIGECCWCGRDVSPYENYNYTEDSQLICSNCYPNYCEWLNEDEQGDEGEAWHNDDDSGEFYYCSDCGSIAYCDDDCYPYCWDCYCKHQEEYNVEEYNKDDTTDDDGEDING